MCNRGNGVSDLVLLWVHSDVRGEITAVYNNSFCTYFLLYNFIQTLCVLCYLLSELCDTCTWILNI